MTIMAPSFTLGLEEEFFLVERWTLNLVAQPPRLLFEECKAEFGSQMSAEYLRSQVEINTKICTTMSEARGDLIHLRRGLARIAGRHGLAPIAAATHPYARWSEQFVTDKPRYQRLAHELQAVGNRMAVCGLHVHVGIENNEMRIALMNRLRCYLPHLLALSTSSPFWQGQKSGLKSFRTSINDSTPRSGIPEAFASWADYEDAVNSAVRAGLIEDATRIWWDIRPSAHYPTLELRVMDVCPLIEDCLCIAALYRCLCRYFCRQFRNGTPQSEHSLFLLNESRWRAARYGTEQGFLSLDHGPINSFEEAIDDLLERIAADARHFECVPEVEHARTIATRGTSADRQLSRYNKMLQYGKPRTSALKAVVNLVIAETLAGTGEAVDLADARSLARSTPQS
jgi:glutamate---cysteine ligase / carboxylate-amine ligase